MGSSGSVAHTPLAHDVAATLGAWIRCLYDLLQTITLVEYNLCQLDESNISQTTFVRDRKGAVAWWQSIP
jgi:hypothetical protein